jgi:hypothetical protein
MVADVYDEEDGSVCGQGAGAQRGADEAEAGRMSTDISDERKAEIVDAYVLLRKRGTDEQEAIDTVCREYSLDEITLKDLVKQISGEKDIL